MHLSQAAPESGRSEPGRSVPGRSVLGRSVPGRSVLGRTALLVLVAVLVTAVVAGAVRWLGAEPTGLERARALAPSNTQRLSWVDWAGVREELGADLDQDSDARELERFLGDAYEEDLSATSALSLSGPAMQQAYGISPASADWEALTQSEDGTLLVLGAEDVDLGLVAERLESAGFTRPSEGDGVWRGGFDLQARIPGELTPVVAHAVLLRDEGLVLFSDESSFLADVVPVVRGGKGSGIADVEDAVRALTEDDTEPLAASVLTGDYTCAELAMSQAGPEAEAQAEQRVDDAGGVSPLRSFGIALLPGGAGRLALGFETDDQARENADARAALAEGEAIGQGGDFEERFRLDEASATGTVVTLEIDPTPRSRVLSDIASGPVLFATC